MNMKKINNLLKFKYLQNQNSKKKTKHSKKNHPNLFIENGLTINSL